MCRHMERASADRRVRSGPACSSVPAEQNGERRRTAPAKQLRQWRGVWNFSPESPPCCVFECSTLATLSHQKQEGEGLGQATTRRRGPRWIKKRRTQTEQMSSGLLHKADFGGSLRDVAEVPLHKVAALQPAARGQEPRGR